MTLALSPSFGTSIVDNARSGNSWLWRNAMIMLALSFACVALQFIDPRLLNGASVWLKPAKFYFSIAIHMMTLSWGITLLPQALRVAKSTQVASALFIGASWIELAYMTYRAAAGEASHFNVGTPIAAMMYSAMAAGATMMTIVTGYLGVKLMRNARGLTLANAAGIGFILSAVMTTAVGFYLGGQGSHWIGGDLSDATGTGFFGWSTTGGDLRVSHFVAMHAAQIVPLAGFSGKRSFVYLVAAIVVALTVLTFMQAIAGVPLFRA